MPKQLYVFPNISALNKNGIRGNYWERLKLAKRHNCHFIELPAHHIKNKSEINLTGQQKGDIASKASISEMYGTNFVPSDFRYILHTEPALVSSNIKWYDKDWTYNYVAMITNISEQIGITPTYIELHPGNKKNTLDDILFSIDVLCTLYKSKGITMPIILLENRTDHAISCGEDMQKLLIKMESDYSHLIKYFGFVVDIRTMYTQITKNYKSNFRDRLVDSIGIISSKYILGVHIHNSHLRAPA